MRTQPRWCIPVVVWQLCAVAAGAVPPTADKAGAAEYSQRLWRIEDGLPQNRIRALCQTPDGYLWIGTAEGLARFDGIRFTIFDQSNTPALHDDGILSLVLASDGALWIGTEGGGLVQYQGGSFRSFGSTEGLTNGFVRAVFEDRRKTLWVGTDRGFFRREGDRFVRLDDTPQVPLASVFNIAEDDSGRIWLATATGLLSVDDNLLSAPSECPAISVRILHRSSQGFLRGVGNSGASLVKGRCLVRDASLPAVPMRSVVEDHDGSLWIGTLGQGLIRFRNGRSTSFTALSGLPDNTVNVVFQDREGNLWIGCEDGLVRLTRRSGTNLGSLDGLEDDNVLTLYADRQDHLWIATFTGQVYRSSGTTVSRYRLPPPAGDLRVRTIFQDRGGILWFGTMGGGLVRQEGTAATVYTKQNGLRSNTIRQILQDRSGVMWIALDSGLSRWDGHSFQNYYLQDGLSYPSTRCMIIDPRGDILVGTDAGLNRIHDQRIVHDAEFAALANEKIWAIHQDATGALWLGTRGGGLLRFQGGKVARFTRDNGLLTNTIFQILEDTGGKLWMSTSLGVISANRKELDAAANGGSQSIRATPYGTADGMATSQMNGGFQPAGVRTQAGDLWFPSVKGAVRISPSRIPIRHTPPVLIERIAADDQSIPLSGNVSIPARSGRVVIDFTLCDLVDPQHASFRYKLEPLEDKWTTALRARSANYTNLPPGQYRFHVMASDASSSSTSEAFVSFTVPPSFYQTSWFYALLAVAAAGAVWGWFALYARQTRARYALLLTERTRLAREMHDTVIQGCVGVSTLLEAAVRFRDLDDAEADALLTAARVQAKSTLEEARQAVWDLRHPADAESSIQVLLDLARKLGPERGIQIDAEMTGRGSLDPETDRTILLVGREALRNAVTHARSAHITVRIDVAASEVRLAVDDDGSGFEAESADTGNTPHFGITGMRERVEKIGGAFSIVSRPGTGTSVSVRIPLPRLGAGESTTRQFPAGAR